MASEEMSFENVGVRRRTTDNWLQMPDYYKLTFEPSAQVS